jgi:CopA family copper-resistance protein
MKTYAMGIILLLGLLSCPPDAAARTVEYSLTIARQPVTITGRAVQKITVNGTIPGPTLHFTESDDAVIHVTNTMDEDTSVHWHGLLLPDGMDGVPGMGGFPGIKPGETFTYRFTIRQTGTYWYHAHSGGQEQDGHYGSLVIAPKGADLVQAERDYVVLLSDFSEESADRIMANLKKYAEYYQYHRRTVGDFLADVRRIGFARARSEAAMWNRMRMAPTDLADVSGYTFLVNGKTPAENWTGLFRPGERVRLRFINASAGTFYDVRIPGLKLTIVAADGQNVEPLDVDEFRFGIAETYDVIVTPDKDQAYTIVAESLDRSGFALASLAPRQGMRGEIPAQRPRAFLTMADMGMAHGAHRAPPPGTDGPSHHGAAMARDDHAGHTMAPGSSDEKSDYETGVPGSGWAETGAPAGTKHLAYKDLRLLGSHPVSLPPEREVVLRLGGTMNRFAWTINGKKFSEAPPIPLSYGERLRLKFVNETMMAHPMHLHGMFVQLENGQPLNKLPNKHTVIIAPGDTFSALLTADEPGEWAFHCHMTYHMKSGMMTRMIVGKPESMPPAGGTHHHPHAGHDGAREAVVSATATHAREHGSQVFHAFWLELSGGLHAGNGTAEWDFHGWIGTDDNKLLLKSEGSHTAGNTEKAEFWALYSRAIDTFWDLQAGVRYDLEPTALGFLAFGIEGLAPWHVETAAHLFVSHDGDVSARLYLARELLLSQRLILQPHLEADVYFQAVDERQIGAGLARAEIGLQLRYEVTRRFAPFVALDYERKIGETASLARKRGADRDALVSTIGLRLLF